MASFRRTKSGLEFADEKFENSPINTPLFINIYEPCPECRDINGQPILNAVTGTQILTVPTPVQLDQRATSFNSAAYVTDIKVMIEQYRVFEQKPGS